MEFVESSGLPCVYNIHMHVTMSSKIFHIGTPASDVQETGLTFFFRELCLAVDDGLLLLILV